MELKTLFGALSAIIGLIAYLPYIREALRHRSQPHPFTWLIFSLAQGTGAGITWQNGGPKGAILLGMGFILCFLIFLLSLRKSKKIIAKVDVLVLILALLAIVFWIFLDHPLLSVLIISGIDVFGYIPTFRKSYHEPFKEPTLVWGSFIIANSFALLALDDYNFLTLCYLISITSANLALWIFLKARRLHLT